MVAVLRVEGSVIDEIHTTADYIARGKRWPIRLPCSRRAKTVTVVAVVPVRVFVPAWQPVHVYTMGGQTDSHVTVSAFTDDLHLEVVEATGGWY